MEAIAGENCDKEKSSDFAELSTILEDFKTKSQEAIVRIALSQNAMINDLSDTKKSIEKNIEAVSAVFSRGFDKFR